MLRMAKRVLHTRKNRRTNEHSMKVCIIQHRCDWSVKHAAGIDMQQR
jgi:hypothetical protein